MWIITLFGFILINHNALNMVRAQGLLEPWRDENRCKIGVIEKNNKGELQCCITLPQFRKQCFVMYANERQERRKQRLKNLIREDLCEHGKIFIEGNHMFCCEEDDDSLDRPCELIPYARVKNFEFKSDNGVIVSNDELKKISDIVKFSRPIYCYLPPVNGPFSCWSFIKRFFYNSVTDECESFIYSGCRGTENNFETIEDCISICMIATDLKTLYQ